MDTLLLLYHLNILVFLSYVMHVFFFYFACCIALPFIPDVYVDSMYTFVPQPSLTSVTSSQSILRLWICVTRKGSRINVFYSPSKGSTMEWSVSILVPTLNITATLLH